MPDKLFSGIFKKGSKTYYTSSLFFPAKIRDDVFILYAFVRLADDLVDCVPQKKEEFLRLAEDYRKRRGGPVLSAFYGLLDRRGIKSEWVEAFLASMEADLTKKKYETIAELEKYIYGSAEVIGLMMAKILGLPEESFPFAGKLGRAMQLVNFIRDFGEDRKLGRTYLPQEDIKKTGDFEKMIRFEIGRYFSWQKEAEKGYRFIPKRYLVPIKTAADMYKWTAGVIAKDPYVVYKKVVKPSRIRILWRILVNFLL